MTQILRPKVCGAGTAWLSGTETTNFATWLRVKAPTHINALKNRAHQVHRAFKVVECVLCISRYRNHMNSCRFVPHLCRILCIVVGPADPPSFRAPYCLLNVCTLTVRFDKIETATVGIFTFEYVGASDR